MKDPAKEEIEQKLIALTADFIDKYLNAEYRKLAEKVIRKLGRKHGVPFLRGRPEIWSAGVVHALAYVNFLFDKSQKPYVSFEDLCAHFGVSPSAATSKSKRIRDLLNMDRFSAEYATKNTKKQMAKIEDVFLQAQNLPGMDAAYFATPVARQGEFIDDRPHPYMDEYYGLCERYEREGATEAFLRSLRQLIPLIQTFSTPTSCSPML